jgi:hypothetical protein
MSNRPLVVSLILLWIVWFLMTHLKGKWISPSEELFAALSIYSDLAQLEDKHFRNFGTYGNIQRLSSLDPALMRKESVESREHGYAFEIVAIGRAYSIRIIPVEMGRYVSLYADETRLIMASYGLPRAGRRSGNLRQDTLWRFMPKGSAR